jgi:hypothetical protein
LKTIVVWVLVLSAYRGDIAVVDNIVAKSNCEALGNALGANFTYRCFAVRKAVP